MPALKIEDPSISMSSSLPPSTPRIVLWYGRFITIKKSLLLEQKERTWIDTARYILCNIALFFLKMCSHTFYRSWKVEEQSIHDEPSVTTPSTKASATSSLSERPLSEDFEMVDSIKQLVRQCDDLLLHPHAQKRDELFAKIKEHPLKENPEVQQIQKILSLLQEHHIDEHKNGSFGRGWIPLNQQDTTIPVPADGNCLYHSVSALLKLFNITTSHEALREQVVAWLKAQLEEARRQNQKVEGLLCENPHIRDHFAASIEAYREVTKHHLEQAITSIQTLRESNQEAQEGIVDSLVTLPRGNQEARIRELLNEFSNLCEEKKLLETKQEQLQNELTQSELLPNPYEAPEELLRQQEDAYLEKCGSNAFYGGAAELFAISQLFQVKITIKRIIGPLYEKGIIVGYERIIENLDRPYGSEFSREILLYNVSSNHFDAGLPSFA